MSDENQTYELTEDGKKILKKVPFTGVRKAIATNLIESWNEAVTTSCFVTVDCTEVKALKAKLAETQKVSYTDIFIRLVVCALEDNPMSNAALNGKKVELYKSVNVGVAVATPDGMLLVPVIKDAEEKSVFQVSDDVKDLAAKVRDKTITQEELSGGTVTVSSLGMFEIAGFTQVLVQPQSLILGFGNIRNEAVVLDDGTIAARPMMYVSASTDHRVIHGEPNMQFFKSLIANFKDPEKCMKL